MLYTESEQCGILNRHNSLRPCCGFNTAGILTTDALSYFEESRKYIWIISSFLDIELVHDWHITFICYQYCQ